MKRIIFAVLAVAMLAGCSSSSGTGADEAPAFTLSRVTYEATGSWLYMYVKGTVTNNTGASVAHVTIHAKAYTAGNVLIDSGSDTIFDLPAGGAAQFTCTVRTDGQTVARWDVTANQ